MCDFLLLIFESRYIFGIWIKIKNLWKVLSSISSLKYFSEYFSRNKETLLKELYGILFESSVKINIKIKSKNFSLKISFSIKELIKSLNTIKSAVVYIFLKDK